jgi:hypothetical protein
MDAPLVKVSELETMELVKIAAFAIIIGCIANLLAILIAQKIS